MTNTASHTEIERKFALGPHDGPPDPSAWPGVHSVSPAERFELDALYFDTADLRLAAAGVTLRRRTGGADDGWHLKVPSDGEGRVEHGLPPDAGQDAPPAEFVAAVSHLSDGAPLQAICRVCTTRVERQVEDATGPVATVCDDTVVTHNLLDPRLDQTWHEMEVELTAAGTLAFLDAVTDHLAAAGVPQVSIASKLRTALTLPGPRG